MRRRWAFAATNGVSVGRVCVSMGWPWWFYLRISRRGFRICLCHVLLEVVR